jgi:hypothetical protein
MKLISSAKRGTNLYMTISLENTDNNPNTLG